MPLLCVAERSSQRRKTAKQLGTLDSRKRHFVLFLADHELGNNPYLEELDQLTKNEIMASYTSFLCLGNTIKKPSIMSNTIKLYLAAASAFILEHNEEPKLLDPQNNSFT